MAYEDRGNGTHAMKCDTPGCNQECLSPGKQELVEDLNLAGWVAVGKDSNGDERFVCPICTRGRHPAQALLNAATGGTGEVMVQAPKDVKKGEPFHDDAGELVGHYTADAEQGDPVGVKVQLPEPPKPPDLVETYDAILEGSDPDDDAHGRVSALAPADPHQRRAERQMDEAADLAERHMEEDIAAHQGAEPAPTPRSMEAPPGASGGGGVVQSARGRPDLTTPEAQAKLRSAPATPRGPQLDTDKLNRAASLFDNLDPTSTDWDPDDE